MIVFGDGSVLLVCALYQNVEQCTRPVNKEGYDVNMLCDPNQLPYM